MKARQRVLVVDDDQAIVEWLTEELDARGFVSQGVTSPEAAITQVSERAFDVVLSDVEMPRMRGIDLVEAIHARRPSQIVVLMTAFGTIDLAMQCMRAGASDFIAKPFPIEALEHALHRALRERRMKREIVRLRSTLAGHPPGELVAVSAGMRRAIEIARRAAATSSTVLLTGESGVGKSALARFVHDESARRSRTFVQLNCAALPGGLVEAELFGVRRGAFTDAREDREGLFAKAHGGTLFLDEIGEMALEVQSKLLVALERGAYRPIGASAEETSDARLIAATNRPLEEALRERRLRPDLYHRLNVIRIEVPALRDRIEDIPRLIDQLLHRLAKREGRSVLGVSEEVLRWMRLQPWPGNVRELANTLERAVAMSDHDVLVMDDFVSSKGEGEPSESFLLNAASEGLDLQTLERRYIKLVLERCGGNKARAARILKLDRTTLYRKLVDGDEDSS